MRASRFLGALVTATWLATGCAVGEVEWSGELGGVGGALPPGDDAPEAGGTDFTAGTIEETDRVIVKFRSASTGTQRLGIEQLHKLRTRDVILGVDAVVYEVDLDDTSSEVVERLKWLHRDEIEYAEIDLMFPPAYATNDPLLGGEWHLGHLGVLSAWDIAQGDGVTVANLDTGVNCNHGDLAANCVAGWNTATNTSDSSDINGHGTMTAGTAVSVGDNAVGGAGVSFASQLMPIRIASDSTGSASCSAIANAVTWAADHGAKVASNSYVISGCSVINDAANYMAAKGGVYVRAAGNDNTQITEANAQNIVVVSATDSNDVKTSWSNYGSNVDIAAPGTPIYCTTKSGGFGTCWGTSFSVPIVAGVLALMYSANPDLSAEQAKSILFSSALDLGASGWDPIYGHGRVDAAKAVALAEATTGTNITDTLAPSVPQNLAPLSLGATQVVIGWSAATDNVAVTGYDVFRDGAKIGSASGTSFTDGGVAAGSSYVYAVAARDAAGNVSAQSSGLSVTTPNAPFSITSTTVAQKTTTSATIQVTTSAPSTVVVAYGTSATQLNAKATSTVAGGAHAVQLTGLRAKTKYFFAVTATKDAGTVATSSVLNFRTASR